MSFLKDKTIVEFLDELAAKTPAPGGGSASALAGAMAAGLVAMVAEFTLGKEKYQKADKNFREILEKAKKLKLELIELIDEDTQAYLAVVKTNGSPEAVKNAARIPLKTAQISLEIYKMASFCLIKGNQRLHSDADCALELARAAIKGALANVKINLPEITEEKERQLLEDSVGEIHRAIPDFSLKDR